MAKKVVIKLQIHDEKEKQKAMKAVSSLSGIESLAMDMKEKKLTVVGEVDAVQVASKLRKFWHAEILTVGPAKEPEKKDEKKVEEKKDDKKEDEKKKKEKEQMEELIKSMYKNYNPYYPPYQRVYSIEENPNSCVIC